MYIHILTQCGSLWKVDLDLSGLSCNCPCIPVSPWLVPGHMNPRLTAPLCLLILTPTLAHSDACTCAHTHYGSLQQVPLDNLVGGYNVLLSWPSCWVLAPLVSSCLKHRDTLICKQLSWLSHRSHSLPCRCLGTPGPSSSHLFLLSQSERCACPAENYSPFHNQLPGCLSCSLSLHPITLGINSPDQSERSPGECLPVTHGDGKHVQPMRLMWNLLWYRPRSSQVKEQVLPCPTFFCIYMCGDNSYHRI